MPKKIAVIDAETDPFKFERIPTPFCWGFYDGKIYRYFWDSFIGERLVLSATQMLLDFLENYSDPLIIYAHNGGKFDFLFFIEKFSGNIRIVNGRILEAKFGIHTFRDSYSILPISLAKTGAGKKKINYKLMEKEFREEFKPEILEYLEADCKSLHNLVIAFTEEFGNVLTIGSAAMREFKKYHKFENVSKGFDSLYRDFYFGGRCQCFETGVIDTPIKLFDVNSMYPKVMQSMFHPVGAFADTGRSITKKTFFIKWEGHNLNAVPFREPKTGGLDFTKDYGIFYSSIHEFNTALDCGLISPSHIISTHDFNKSMRFADFVDHFYSSRLIAKKHGDVFKELFYKLILNSAYGKFAQNPEHFYDSIILPFGDLPPEQADGNEYYLEYRHEEYGIWSKAAAKHAYYNVATAASITGGSRSIILRSIADAIRPLYCDTDSIMCNDFKSGAHIDPKELGAWKLESTGTQVAIAGKKMYALMDGDICVKKASKGVNLPPLAIFQIARGDTVEARNDAPSFKLGVPGKSDSDRKFSHTFIERRISRTGKQKPAD